MNTGEWTPEENAHLLSELRWLYFNHPDRLSRSDRIMLAALDETETRNTELTGQVMDEARKKDCMRKRAKKAEREMDVLLLRFIEEVGSERAFCPTSKTMCNDHSYDCCICWRKWASQQAAGGE